MRYLALFLMIAFIFNGCTPSSPELTIQPSLTPSTEHLMETEPLEPAHTPTETTPPKLVRRTSKPKVSPTPTVSDAIPFLPVPTHALLNEGPWGLLPADNGLWVMQADGSGLTRVYPEGIILQVAASQIGHRAAFVKQTRNADASSNLELYVISASDWKAQKIADMGLKDTGHYPKQDFENEAFEVERAVTEQKSIAWSPDGQYLAFISGQDGVSADLYVYPVASGEVRRLTDGPSQAYNISWSPDSQYIFHSGAVAFGTGAGIASAGAWVASVDGSSVIEIDKGWGDASLLGWLTHDSFMISNWNVVCGSATLQEINFKTGTKRILWPGCMEQFRYDREKGQIIITNTESLAAWERFPEKKQGTYIVTPGQDGFRKISDQGFDDIFLGNDAAALYAIMRQEGLYAVGSDGQILSSDTSLPYTISRPSDCEPDKNYLFLIDWATDTTYIVQLGKGIVASTTGISESCYPSPTDPDLVFTRWGTGLNAFRIGEWKVQLVSEAIEYGSGIYWMP